MYAQGYWGSMLKSFGKAGLGDVLLVQTAITNTMDWWHINNRNSFLIVLEVGSLRSLCQHSWVLVRAVFCFTGFLLYSHMVERGQESSLSSLYKGTNSMHDGVHLLKIPSSDNATLGVRASKREFWGNTNIQSSAGEMRGLWNGKKRLHFSIRKTFSSFMWVMEMVW